MNRRHFLNHVAGYSMMALPGLEFVRNIQANAQELKKNNKSVIIMWMGGGPATIDIWDLKPGAPTGGDFKPIQTDVTGIQISEHMKETAKVFKDLIILRSLTTTEGDHNRGRQLMHTSYTPNPAIAFPSMGAVLAHEAPKIQGYRDISLPNYVSVGGAADGPGFLGMNYSAFTVQNPGTPPQNIRSPFGTGIEAEDRVRRRQRLFNDLESQFMSTRAPHLSSADRAKFGDASKAHRDVYNKGFSLVASKEGRVFEINTESAKLQEEYGATGAGASNFGRSALLARRLVESGVSAVEINLGGWDTHNQNFQALSQRQLPQMDKPIAALVRDLNDRGLYKNTVIVWMGEFARTPRINANAGRDHWSRSWSIMIGGGLMKGGQTYGATTEDGMAVKDNPVKIGDVFATVYKALGIDPSTQVRDAIGRPFPIAGGGGKPIEKLF